MSEISSNPFFKASLTPRNRPSERIQRDKTRQNGSKSRQINRHVANWVAKNDANLAQAPRFRQVPIESPL
ncbi:hypothetical protein TNCV_3818031 [Trichonephila clavipes]|nr:hypothetical protein TNCV_3818031 [Trichonephila clavipes]